MVVVPEPAVKGSGAFCAGGIDRAAVSPAGEQRADTALGLAVGLWPVGASAQVADPERFASDRVDGRAVGGAVVGDQPCDGDAVARVEGHGAAEKRDRGAGLLV